MMRMPCWWKNSFTSRLRPAPPERQKRSLPPVRLASFALRAAGVGSDIEATASFSQMLGTLISTLGRTSGSFAIIVAGSARYVRNPRVLPRQASPKPKMWLIGNHRRSTG